MRLILMSLFAFFILACAKSEEKEEKKVDNVATRYADRLLDSREKAKEAKKKQDEALAKQEKMYKEISE